MPEKDQAPSRRYLGSINISPHAITLVAGIAALQCFGVVGMASRTFQDGISELISGKDNLTKGIEVNIDDDKVIVDLYIIVEYGVRIREVASNVIENVRYAIENQTGLQALKVNVIVQGVRIDKK